jgi:polysaccharide export outer membrane protein
MSFPAAALAQNGHSTDPARDGAVLRPGDVIRIVVWRLPELSGEFTVAENRTIVHPVYQQIRVASVPIPEVEALVRDVLLRYESDPQFVVEPLLRIVVSGEVRQPGLFSVPPGMTVAQAGVSAGGMTTQARTSKVTLVRDGTRRDYALSGEKAEAFQMPIRSGDQVVVQRKSAILRDYFWPIASAVGAVAGVVNIWRRW